MSAARYRIEQERAPREPVGGIEYVIHRNDQVIATYRHDHRGDEHEIRFVDGTREQWPLGAVTDMIEGGGPRPLELTSRAIAYLESWARRSLHETFEVRFFGADCRTCGRHFEMPLLSDFQSYGEFILHGARGDIFGYLAALDAPWDDIRDRCVAAGLRWSSDGRDVAAIERFQGVIAACADPIAGQPLVMRTICPSCGSRDVAYGDGHPRRARKIPVVTFHVYLALSDEERSRRVTELLRRSPLP